MDLNNSTSATAELALLSCSEKSKTCSAELQPECHRAVQGALVATKEGALTFAQVYSSPSSNLRRMRPTGVSSMERPQNLLRTSASPAKLQCSPSPCAAMTVGWCTTWKGTNNITNTFYLRLGPHFGILNQNICLAGTSTARNCQACIR